MTPEDFSQEKAEEIAKDEDAPSEYVEYLEVERELRGE